MNSNLFKHLLAPGPHRAPGTDPAARRGAVPARRGGRRTRTARRTTWRLRHSVADSRSGRGGGRGAGPRPGQRSTGTARGPGPRQRRAARPGLRAGKRFHANTAPEPGAEHGERNRDGTDGAARELASGGPRKMSEGPVALAVPGQTQTNYKQLKWISFPLPRRETTWWGRRGRSRITQDKTKHVRFTVHRPRCSNRDVSDRPTPRSGLLCTVLRMGSTRTRRTPDAQSPVSRRRYNTCRKRPTQRCGHKDLPTVLCAGQHAYAFQPKSP